MIAVIDVCGNNLSSIGNALARLGYEYKLTHKPRDIEQASHVIIPGVGSARIGMQALVKYDLLEVIRQIRQPLLGICLGMQLLLDYSEEGDVACLGLIPGVARRLRPRDNFPVPHMGWNKLLWNKESSLSNGLSDESYVYFVHSYALISKPGDQNELANCQYSDRFSAIIQQGNRYGMQFHPEKSADTGITLLTNFLQLESYIMKIIPAIDLQNGQCVRLRQGKFEDNTIYPQSPQELIKKYSSRGAKHIHIVDLDGARCGDIQQLPLIQSMLSDDVTLQLGGGIRSLATARACLDAGISQLVIGSLAITNPDVTINIINSIGAEKIVLALDVNIQNGLPIPAIHGWQTTSISCLWDVAESYEKTGITNILCTDIACDGMMNGPNLLLYREALTRFPKINWQASGGIRHQQDIEKLGNLGVNAAIVGRALYESDFDLSGIITGETTC